MSEQAAEQQAPSDPAPQEGQEPVEPKTFDADYVANLRKESAKYRTEAKAAAVELDKVRSASLSEAEKAVAEAEKRGRSAAATEFGQRLVRSDFVAAAARRNAEFDAAAVLDDLNLARFVGEDGEPDTAAIGKAVERLVPELSAGSPRPPSFDGGARTTPPPAVDMNTALRRAAGRA